LVFQKTYLLPRQPVPGSTFSTGKREEVVQLLEAKQKTVANKPFFPSSLPKTTTCQAAKQLHAILRYVPGYALARQSPQRANWTIHALLALAEDRPDLWLTLPQGCIGALYQLAEALPFRPAFTKELSIEYLCSLIVQLGYYKTFVEHINETFTG
jgi:hypothetical protein